jgi:hypothetical protein
MRSWGHACIVSQQVVLPVKLRGTLHHAALELLQQTELLTPWSGMGLG